MSQRDWNGLLELAHTDKRRAFEVFTDFYLSTSGQRYYTDTHQLNLYLEDYHQSLDRRLGACVHSWIPSVRIFANTRPMSSMALFA
jgi:hypothetical protein